MTQTRLLAPSFVGFQRAWIRPDVIAGLTVWAVLVPESLAYATIAGVPRSSACTPRCRRWCSTRWSARPATSSSRRCRRPPPCPLGVVSTVTDDTGEFVVLTAALALATGLAALLAGVLRLGFLAAFISEPVLKGFIIGLALTIMVGQLPALIGVEKGSGNFFEKLWDLLQQLGDAQALATVVGVSSLAVLLALRRWAPRVPASLVVAALGIAAVAVLGLDEHGLAIVGTIDSGLPSVGLPDVGRSDFVELFGAAIGVMLVGFAEGLGAAKTYAAREGYDIDPNRELLGLGAANVGAGLTSGMVVNGSLSKTAVNGGAGARSQISGMTAAVLTLVTLLLLTGLFEKLPEATLAAIVIAAVIELVDIDSLRRLWRVRGGRAGPGEPGHQPGRLPGRRRRAARGAAAGHPAGPRDRHRGLPGAADRPHLAAARRRARAGDARVGREAGRVWVDAARNPDLPAAPDALVVRVEAPLLFANADYVRERVRDLAAATARRTDRGAGRPATPSIDVTASAMLVQLRADLRRSGVELVLAEDVGQVRDVLTQAEPEGLPPVYVTIEDALGAPPPPP